MALLPVEVRKQFPAIIEKKFAVDKRVWHLISGTSEGGGGTSSGGGVGEVIGFMGYDGNSSTTKRGHTTTPTPNAMEASNGTSTATTTTPLLLSQSQPPLQGLPPPVPHFTPTPQVLGQSIHHPRCCLTCQQPMKGHKKELCSPTTPTTTTTTTTTTAAASSSSSSSSAGGGGRRGRRGSEERGSEEEDNNKKMVVV